MEDFLQGQPWPVPVTASPKLSKACLQNPQFLLQPQTIEQAKQSGVNSTQDLLEVLIQHKGKQLKPQEAGSLLLSALQFDLKTTPSLNRSGKAEREAADTAGIPMDAKTSRQLYLCALVLKQ
jgi:hypothetical protein